MQAAHHARSCHPHLQVGHPVQRMVYFYSSCTITALLTHPRCKGNSPLQHLSLAKPKTDCQGDATTCIGAGIKPGLCKVSSRKSACLSTRDAQTAVILCNVDAEKTCRAMYLRGLQSNWLPPDKQALAQRRQPKQRDSSTTSVIKRKGSAHAPQCWHASPGSVLSHTDLERNKTGQLHKYTLDSFSLTIPRPCCTHAAICLNAGTALQPPRAQAIIHPDPPPGLCISPSC